MEFIQQLSTSISPVVEDANVELMLEQYYALLALRLMDETLLLTLSEYFHAIDNDEKLLNFIGHVWINSEDRKIIIDELSASYHLDTTITSHYIAKVTPFVYKEVASAANKQAIPELLYLQRSFNEIIELLPSWADLVIPIQILVDAQSMQAPEQQTIDNPFQDNTFQTLALNLPDAQITKAHTDQNKVELASQSTIKESNATIPVQAAIDIKKQEIQNNLAQASEISPNPHYQQPNKNSAIQPLVNTTNAATTHINPHTKNHELHTSNDNKNFPVNTPINQNTNNFDNLNNPIQGNVNDNTTNSINNNGTERDAMSHNTHVTTMNIKNNNSLHKPKPSIEIPNYRQTEDRESSGMIKVVLFFIILLLALGTGAFYWSQTKISTIPVVMNDDEQLQESLQQDKPILNLPSENKPVKSPQQNNPVTVTSENKQPEILNTETYIFKPEKPTIDDNDDIFNEVVNESNTNVSNSHTVNMPRPIVNQAPKPVNPPPVMQSNDTQPMFEDEMMPEEVEGMY